jgi:hypothetical protein
MQVPRIMNEDNEEGKQHIFHTSVGFSAPIRAAWKGVTLKHVESLLNSESKHDLDNSDDKSGNSNCDATDSDNRDESNNDSHDYD